MTKKTIREAIITGFLYGIQSDFLPADEVEHRVAGFKHTNGFKEAVEAIDKLIQTEIAEAERRAVERELKQILAECDFEKHSDDFKDYNRLAQKKAMGYCMICGHDPRLFKAYFEDRIKQLTDTNPTNREVK